METIKEVLMRRDGMGEVAADVLIAMAKADFFERVEAGDIEADIDVCAEYFGLEPDYAMEWF